MSIPGVVRRCAARQPSGARVAGIIAASCLTLCGCAVDDADLDHFIQTVRARPLKPAPAAPALPPATVSRYRSTGLRDPFRQSAAGQRPPPPAAPSHTPHRSAEPLQAYAVSELKLVGTLRLSTGDYGLIKTPSGDIVWVAPGHRVGKRHGQILDIGTASLRLREVAPDDHSGRRTRIAILRMDAPPSRLHRSTTPP